MGFKYRSPSVKIGGVRIRKNKKGYSISRKTILGGRKTYNSGTGKTTTTYKTGIKGLSYQTTKGEKNKDNGMILLQYILVSPFLLVYWIFKLYYYIFKYVYKGILKIVNRRKKNL